MAGTPWYGYSISQRYGQNGEQGIDLATPFHTEITALYAGTVRWAGRTQWACGSSGGEVTIVCNVPGLGVLTSYYLHMDVVDVKVGDTVPQGAHLGFSGGQTSGGNWPVVNCPQQGLIYSTGAHTEFGFNASWVSGPGHNIDPTFAITQARNGTLPATSPDGSATMVTTLAGSGPTQINIDPSALEAGLLQFYTLSSATHRVVTQPTGFEGICEAIDYSEQWTPWNWFNPTGSIMANIKPFLLRAGLAVIAGLVCTAILWSYIQAPVKKGLQLAGVGATAAFAPEALPAVAGATGATAGMQEAPQATAK